MEKKLKNTDAAKKEANHFEIVSKSERRPTHGIEFLKKQLEERDKSNS